MNQILNVDYSSNNKKEKNGKNNGPIEIQSIVKFFSIIILIFGICMIASGSYSMYKGNNKESSKTKPVIHVEQTNETQITLQVTHDKELEKVTYEWNGEGATEVPFNKGVKAVNTTIEIPSGTNTLKVYAKDVAGQEIEYQKVYTAESDININIEPEGNKLKITANGINQLQYMTYRWDNEDETRVDIESNEVEELVEIPRGLHKLTIIVVDINNKTETKEQDVNAVTKPKVEVTTDGTDFIIKASDEDGIKKIEFVINEEEKKYILNLEEKLSPEERKEFEYKYPLRDGENKLKVTVYNNSDITETFGAKFNKE